VFFAWLSHPSELQPFGFPSGNGNKNKRIEEITLQFISKTAEMLEINGRATLNIFSFGNFISQNHANFAFGCSTMNCSRKSSGSF
jgi:hypothetical protein